jgi:hypothetical protein
MKSLNPQRQRALLYHVLSIVLIAATFVQGTLAWNSWFPCGLAAALFAFLGLRARYNLNSESA